MYEAAVRSDQRMRPQPALANQLLGGKDFRKLTVPGERGLTMCSFLRRAFGAESGYDRMISHEEAVELARRFQE